MEMDRRTSLQALAISGLALGANQAATANVLAADRGPVRVVIYDGRYPSCRDFAKVHAGQDVLLVDTQAQDIGLAWRGKIAAHIVKRPGRIEGLSLFADQFVSALMARDHGLRLKAEDRVTSKLSAEPSFFRWTLA